MPSRPSETLVRAGAARFGSRIARSARGHWSAIRASALVTAWLALLALAPMAAGDDTAPAATPVIKAGPCDAPECRQFDFWVGDWDVFTADGKLAGTNTVERILHGCVIAENWSGTRGSNGKSFNLYSAGDKKWHQTWVDDQGTLLELAGEFKDGRMVLEGDSPGPNGAETRNRITWEKLPDGRVSQHWEVSSDGGLKWVDAFLGFYTRKQKNAKEATKR